MNDMKTGPEGLRLIQHFEGDPRLEARLCEGGRWELGYGCTFWPNNRAVVQGEYINSDQVEPLLRHALKTFEDVVRKHVTVELTQYQFDALVALCYNIGETNFSASSVLTRVNERRFEDAAGAFGLWVKATSSVDGKGNPWLGPTGKPCQYRRALRGLLRRHYAEACVFLGFDWEEACADDFVRLRADKVWEEDNNRWHDRMVWGADTTSFPQVLNIARKYPLNALAAPTIGPIVTIINDDPMPIEEVRRQIEEAKAPAIVREDAMVIVGNRPAVVIAPPPPIVQPRALPPPKLPDPPIPVGQQTSAVDAARKSEDWSTSAKNMVYSRRFWGLALVMGGRLWMLKTGSNAVLGVVSDPLVTEMFSGFAVMMVGELVQHWGERKATRPLK